MELTSLQITISKVSQEQIQRWRACSFCAVLFLKLSNVCRPPLKGEMLKDPCVKLLLCDLNMFNIKLDINVHGKSSNTLQTT